MVREASRWFWLGSERTRVQRVRRVSLSWAGDAGGEGNCDGSLPESVVESATVVYPTGEWC